VQISRVGGGGGGGEIYPHNRDQNKNSLQYLNGNTMAFGSSKVVGREGVPDTGANHSRPAEEEWRESNEQAMPERIDRTALHKVHRVDDALVPLLRVTHGEDHLGIGVALHQLAIELASRPVDRGRVAVKDLVPLVLRGNGRLVLGWCSGNALLRLRRFVPEVGMVRALLEHADHVVGREAEDQQRFLERLGAGSAEASANHRQTRGSGGGRASS
jgi:hypothetical protein